MHIIPGRQLLLFPSPSQSVSCANFMSLLSPASSLLGEVKMDNRQGHHLLNFQDCSRVLHNRSLLMLRVKSIPYKFLRAPPRTPDMWRPVSAVLWPTDLNVAEVLAEERRVPIIGPSCEHKTENLDKQVMKVNSQQWRMGLCIMLSIVYPHRTTVKDRKDF